MTFKGFTLGVAVHSIAILRLSCSIQFRSTCTTKINLVGLLSKFIWVNFRPIDLTPNRLNWAQIQFLEGLMIFLVYSPCQFPRFYSCLQNVPTHHTCSKELASWKHL
jgi:hypothetical protein